jgi:hypothetical protein
VQSWHVSVQREFGRGMLLDFAYVGNKADDLLLVANYNQAVVNNAAGTIPLASRRPISTFGDITYVFNGGKSRYSAFQTKYEWRMGADITLLSSLTLSKAKDNGAGALENQNGNFPAPQDFRNLDADYAVSAYAQPYNSTTSFVWSLPFGRGKRWGSGVSPAMDVLVGGWQLTGINMFTPGEMVTFQYSPAPAFQVSAITNDFSGANNYRPNITCDPYAARGPAVDHQLVQPRLRGLADRSEPAVRQFAAQQRPRPQLLAGRSRRHQGHPARRTSEGAGADRGVQPVQPGQLHVAGRQSQQRQLRHHHVDLRRAPGAAGIQGDLVRGRHG